MGHKVNPRGFRIGMTQSSPSRWFSRTQYNAFLREDTQIRSLLKKKLKEAGVARIECKRAAEALTVVIHTSRPGVVIGRGGAGIEELKSAITKLAGVGRSVTVQIQEVDQPNTNAELVVQGIIEQLEKRVPFRMAMKRAIESVKQGGAKGVKIVVSGRLNGAEIARTETLGDGSVPLHTLRADIDYARGAAHTIYGAVGVKVWVYHGEVFEEKQASARPRAAIERA